MAGRAQCRELPMLPADEGHREGMSSLAPIALFEMPEALLGGLQGLLLRNLQG